MQLNESQLRAQVLNLTLFISNNPAENLTILSNEVLAHGCDCIARFNSHLQAVKAVCTIRELLAKESAA